MPASRVRHTSRQWVGHAVPDIPAHLLLHAVLTHVASPSCLASGDRPVRTDAPHLPANALAPNCACFSKASCRGSILLILRFFLRLAWIPFTSLLAALLAVCRESPPFLAVARSCLTQLVSSTPTSDIGPTMGRPVHISAVLSLACLLPLVYGDFLVEKGTLKYQDKEGETHSMPMALANFGKPMYGASTQ